MPLHCDRCRTALPESIFNTPAPVACPGCHAPLLARVFPAFFRAPVVGRAAETVGSEEDASCFFHPRKKAVVPCGRCGRFLCALCDLEIDGRHLCPSCVTAAGAATTTAAAAGALSNERFLYDQLAASVALLPLVLFWPVTLFTAPVALYYAVRYWHEPTRGIIPRGRAVMAVAAALAVLEIAAWGVFGYYLWFERPGS